MATFLELCEDLTTESGAVGTAPSSVVGQTGRQGKAVGWVKRAWTLIQNLRADWTYLRAEFEDSLIASTASYSAATFNLERFGAWIGDTGSYRPLTLYDPDIGVSDESPLHEIDYESWRSLYDRGAQIEQRPRHYCRAPDQTLRVGPIPDKAYTLRGEYRKSPQVLAANDDVPDMPTRFHDVIVYRVPTISALQRRGDEVVAHLLRENESRWESPSEADRDRLEALARSVARRLLNEPAVRLEAASGESSFEYVHALRELFGLRG